MNRRKWIYIGVLIVVAAIVSIASFSYAFLTRVDEQHGKINIVAGTLDYKIESDDLENNSITLSANESKEIEITIKSVNKINSKYQLYTNDVENVDIRYTDEEEPGIGTITSNGTKTIKVVLENNSGTDKTITFGVQGGFEDKTLTLEDNRVAVALGDGLCKIGDVYNFEYTGDVQEFTAKCSGTYKLETWGAQGYTISADFLGGKGGYSTGDYLLNKDTNLFVYVGQQGVVSNSSFNGGGYGSASGGGMTDIRTVDGLWNNVASLNSQLIVAGGGGGANHRGDGYGDGSGGAGGGLNGIAGTSINNTNGFGYGIGAGGSQTSGGNFHWSGGTSGIAAAQYSTWTYNAQQSPTVAGTRGQGGNGVANQSGGGGGYYGGAGAAHGGAGGGSGYIGGVDNGQTIAGNQTITEPDGTTATGHSGNGYARITYLGKEIELDAAGGTVSETTVYRGNKVGILPTPTKTGYTFTGWYTSDNQLVTENTGVSSLPSLTLTAHYTPITYTIRYNANGGTGTMANQTMTYDANQTLSSNTFTRSGKTFVGWSTVSGNQLLYYSATEKVSTNNEFMQYGVDLSPYFNTYGSREYSIMIDLKSANISKENRMSVYCQNGSNSRWTFGYVVPLTTSYQNFVNSFTPSLHDSNEVKSQLAFYGVYNTGNYPSAKNVYLILGKFLKNGTSKPNLSSTDNAVLDLYAVWK